MINKPSLLLGALLSLYNPWSAISATLSPDDIIATDIGTSAVTTDQAVLKISPANGDRTVLSGNGIGTGATMNTPNSGGAGTAIASTPSGVIYFFERSAAANPKTIIKVDLATGNRAVISGNGIGTGTPFTNCAGISWDLATSTILFAENSTAAAGAGIVRVDPVTGNRTQITGFGVGSGAAINSLRAPCSSPSGTIYYYENSSPNTKTIISVNPATGARTVISGNGVGSGAAFNGSINNLVWDRSTSTLLVSDPGTNAASSGILRIDPLTGNRTQITGNGVGSGVAINAPKWVAVSYTGAIYYYEGTATGVSKAIVSVNPANGARTVLSAVTPATGAGTAFINMGGIAVVSAPLPTTVSSINRVNSTPSNAGTVNWTVTFAAAVTGVTAANFTLSGTATAGASIGTPVASNGGLTWNVPVTTGAGFGTLELDMSNGTGLLPAISNLPVTGQS